MLSLTPKKTLSKGGKQSKNKLKNITLHDFKTGDNSLVPGPSSRGIANYKHFLTT